MCLNVHSSGIFLNLFYAKIDWFKNRLVSLTETLFCYNIQFQPKNINGKFVKCSYPCVYLGFFDLESSIVGDDLFLLIGILSTVSLVWRLVLES